MRSFGNRSYGLILGFVVSFVVISKESNVSAFVFSRIRQRHQTTELIFGDYSPILSIENKKSLLRFEDHVSASTANNSRLLMVNNNDEGPQGTGVGFIAGFLLLIFVAGSVVPFAGTLNIKGQLSIADSVVTKQDASGKFKNVESKQLSLSRSAIQEKLNSVPVFYVVTEGKMGTALYMSFDDARAASDGIPSSTVKGTTLDQVMYPLLLKRGRMRMAPPPTEVVTAEENLVNLGKSSDSPAYRLVPSKTSVQQAKEFGLELSNSDIPLFVADRLAFGSPKGPQLPLFLDKDDCLTSYKRLRQGKSSLPEDPNIRTSTLLEILVSMEKGTRPGLNQLAFYATAGDLLRLTEMISN